jgi:tetratricopeptide (TPR) repeat protein
MAIVHHYIQRAECTPAKQHALELLNRTGPDGEMTSYELSEFYQQLSRIMIYLGEYRAAVRAAECCIENSARSGAESSQPAQILCRAYLLTGNVENAGEMIDKALRHLHDTEDPGNGIWYLFKSAFYFVQNMNKESLHLLTSEEQHFNSSLPLKTFAKLFELINILEIGDLQWFEYKAESYRKRLERISIVETERLKQLYGLLKILANKVFPDFSYSPEKVTESLSLFDSHAAKWDPLGYEVIDLGSWIRKKM